MNKASFSGRELYPYTIGTQNCMLVDSSTKFQSLYYLYGSSLSFSIVVCYGLSHHSQLGTVKDVTQSEVMVILLNVGATIFPALLLLR